MLFLVSCIGEEPLNPKADIEEFTIDSQLCQIIFARSKVVIRLLVLLWALKPCMNFVTNGGLRSAFPSLFIGISFPISNI